MLGSFGVIGQYNKKPRMLPYGHYSMNSAPKLANGVIKMPKFPALPRINHASNVIASRVR